LKVIAVCNKELTVTLSCCNNEGLQKHPSPTAHPTIVTPTYSHTHTHTLQHSIHDDCVTQPLSPHTNHKTNAVQTRKATKSKAHSVVCNLLAPHPYTKKKKNVARKQQP